MCLEHITAEYVEVICCTRVTLDIFSIVETRAFFYKTREQIITRDMEIKNKLTVTRGEAEGGNRGKSSRNMYKGPMDKDNGDWGSGLNVGGGGR